MTDLEELIRETFAHRAEQAPPAESLVAGVRNRRRRRRLNRTIVAVAAVAAATTAAVVLPLTLAGHGTTQPTDKPTPTATPSPDEQIIGFHGIEITVPASWTINDTHCSEPAADTVIRDEGIVAACGGARAPGVSSVELLTTSKSWEATMSHVVTVTNAHGVVLRRGRMPGRPVVVLVPSTGVLAFVNTVSPALTNRILDSLRAVDVDITGCKMRETQLQLPLNGDVGGAHQSYVIPPGPKSIAICHYEDTWMVSGLVVSGSAATRIVDAANAAPSGLVHVFPDKSAYNRCNTPVRLGGERGSGFILWAHYSNGSATELWFQMGDCGPLGITNGERAGALTLGLARAINEPLHRGFGIPGHLLPGPG